MIQWWSDNDNIWQSFKASGKPFIPWTTFWVKLGYLRIELTVIQVIFIQDLNNNEYTFDKLWKG